MNKTLIAAAITSIVLSGCGGGGGGAPSAPPTSPSSPPVVRTTPIENGYFGYFDGEAVETSSYVSYAFLMDWGNWDTDEEAIGLRIIAQLQEAKSRGITKAIVAVGFLTWTNTYQIKPISKLQAFRDRLKTLGLYDMIETIYPIDEPDVAMKLHGLTEINLITGVANAAIVFNDKKLMVIYGDSGGFPAQSHYDIVGKDKYGHGVVTIPLLTGQTEALVVGGANPWREDPNPAIDYAKAHPEVSHIVNFLYGDYSDKGIKNNGMEPIFKAAGLRLKNGS